MISGNNIDKKKYTVSATLYSQIEFDLTIDGIKDLLKISEDTVLASYRSETSCGEYRLKINLNTRKKFPTDIFATIIIKHNDAVLGETIAKDFHYGLGIIGTEKHESRRIDNQLRGRAGRQGDA